MKRALKSATLIWLLLGIGFGLPREQMKPSIAQAQNRPNIALHTGVAMSATEGR